MTRTMTDGMLGKPQDPVRSGWASSSSFGCLAFVRRRAPFSHSMLAQLPLQSHGKATPVQISSRLTFEDGHQILVSVQKPLGIILEQEDELKIRIAGVDPTGSAAAAGLRQGDVLVAVQMPT